MLNDLEIPTPERQAFANYIDGIDCNPYAYETKDHARYSAAYEELSTEGLERRVVL